MPSVTGMPAHAERTTLTPPRATRARGSRGRIAGRWSADHSLLLGQPDHLAVGFRDGRRHAEARRHAQVRPRAWRRRSSTRPNSIIAGDVYTLDKIFEPLLITNPRRAAHAVARAGLHGQQGRQDVHVQAAAGREVLRRQAADRRRRRLLAQPRAARTRTGRSASSTSRSSRSRRRAPTTVVAHLSAAVGAVPLGHLGVRERDHARELRRQDREGVLREPDRHRAVHAQRASRKGGIADAGAQPALLAGGQALPRRGRLHVRQRRQPARAAAARAARSR